MPSAIAQERPPRTKATKWADVVKISTLSISLALSLPAAAQTPAKDFEAQKKNAFELTRGLGEFLEQFIGECTDAEGGSCREQSRSYREKMTGHKVYFTVADESASMLSPGPESRGGSDFIIDLTPIFPAGGYALTRGAPKRTDMQGNPLMSVMPITFTLPEDKSWNDIKRMVSTRALRIEVVATPKGIWALNKKGGGKWYGVTAELDAILIIASRSGDVVASWKR